VSITTVIVYLLIADAVLLAIAVYVDHKWRKEAREDKAGTPGKDLAQ
jgi:hypothetical protein